MICPNCTADVADNSAFCPKCGKPLNAPQGASPPATPPATPAESLHAAKAAGAAHVEPEQELWHGSYSPKAMYGSWLLAIVATLIAVVLSVIVPTFITWFAAFVIVVVLWLSLAAYYLIARLSVEYSLSTQRFIHKSGLLRRVTNRIAVIDIDDVTYEQGLFERMYGVGTIKLLSSDLSDPKLVLRGIDDVQRVATMIDDARRDERRKRAIYMETV
jgi:uncharacterized membrane protein YdbT with pleckstrin-like domain